MTDREEKIEKLKAYFAKCDYITMAFLFGSQANERAHTGSDWDIAAYFTPEVSWPEWEEHGRAYPAEDTVWSDCMRIVESDNVDFIVLNRIPSSIAAAALQGMPLIIKDHALWLRFMLIVTREAEDYCELAKDYFAISERSASLSDLDQKHLVQILGFLHEQMTLYAYFENFLEETYNDVLKRSEVERWIENIVNACIDLAKTVLASEKKRLPDAYRDILRGGVRALGLSEDAAVKFEAWAKLRNVLAHEYLDIKWQRISAFIRESKPYVDQFVEAAKRLLRQA